MTFWTRLLARLLAALMLALATPVLAAAPRATTAHGMAEGMERGGVIQFLGLPYAAPPIGDLRWRAPQSPRPWQGVRQAKSFAPICAQVTTLGPFAGPVNSNENCLYLNVFTPDTKARLPVLVWVHGGGYVDGASSDYDAAQLAARAKMVVVTINYRLNLMGFLLHPALGTSGNFGILDQQAALRWVSQNIKAFGGDAGNVTLGGQSAGAGAVTANMVSPGAKGLFHRAILQSGGYTPFTAQDTARERGAKFVAAAGCARKSDAETARCLRALPATRILALAGTPSATSPLVSGAMVDGTTIPAPAFDLVSGGHFNAMPVMIGTTRDEGNFAIGIAQYFRKGRTPTTARDFEDYLARSYGGRAYPARTVAALKKRYPLRGTAQAAWNSVHRDMLACRGQMFAAALEAHAPVYAYRFDDTTAPSYFPKMPGFVPGAYHTADIGYLFTGYHGGPDGVPARLAGKQVALSDRMIAAWGNFARSGNPNGKGDAPWPKAPAVFLQDNNWKTALTGAQFASAHQCSFWAPILPQR